MSSPGRPRIPDWYSRLVDKHARVNSEYLEFGLITYGSLLHRDEIQSLFSSYEPRVTRVRVQGFRRCFNKSVADHLRDPDGDQRGVLNLQRREDCWFNGLLVHPVKRSPLEKYSFREREYGLTRVPRDQVHRYGSSSGSLGAPDWLYTCLLEDPDQLDPGLDPVPGYLKLCLEGAGQWGEQFQRDFLRTTRVGQQSLEHYLEERSR